MSMRSAPPVDHTGIESGQGRSTWETLKRGVELSPEIRRGIGVTIALAVLSTVGKLLVPFVVQRTTDEGILAAGGPDAGIVLRYVLLAMVGVAVTALCSYFVNVRLFTASENGLSSLRIKAFRHIHDLSVLTQNTERRGSLVSRVTSDVDTISMFVQFGGLMFLVNIAQLLLATVLMVIYSPPLAGVVWACYVPLFFIIRQFQGIVGRAYTAVRERVGDMLAAISEAVVGAATIRAYGVEDRTAERIDTAVEAHRRSAVRAQTRAVMAFTTGQLVSGLTTAVVIVVGTLLAVNGSLTPGRAARLPLPRQPLHHPGPAGHRDPQRDAERRRRLAAGHRDHRHARRRGRPGGVRASSCRADRSRSGSTTSRSPTPAATPCSTTCRCGSPRGPGWRSSARPVRASRRWPSCSPG